MPAHRSTFEAESTQRAGDGTRGQPRLMQGSAANYLTQQCTKPAGKDFCKWIFFSLNIFINICRFYIQLLQLSHLVKQR